MNVVVIITEEMYKDIFNLWLLSLRMNILTTVLSFVCTVITKTALRECDSSLPALPIAF